MSSFDEYITNYPTMKKHIVYGISRGSGGIGDIMLYFSYLLHICMEKKIQLHYCNIETYPPIAEYIQFVHKDLCITDTFLKSVKRGSPCIMDSLEDNVYYMVHPSNFYGVNLPTLLKGFTTPLSEIFYFSYKIIETATGFLRAHSIETYTSIHLRLGDRYLETDEGYSASSGDIRTYDENRIYECIESLQGPVIFFCDNAAYKRKIKEKYPRIITTDFMIGHTNLGSTSDLQVLHAVTEFYLLTKSDKIYRGSQSGFSTMASFFHRIPAIDI